MIQQDLTNGEWQKTRNRRKRTGGTVEVFLNSWWKKEPLEYSQMAPGDQDHQEHQKSQFRVPMQAHQDKTNVHHFHFECYFRACAVFITFSDSHCTYRLLERGSVHASIYSMDNYLQWQWLNQRIIFFPQRSGQPGFISVIKTVGVHVPVIKFPVGKRLHVWILSWTLTAALLFSHIFQDRWHLLSQWEKYSCHLSNRTPLTQLTEQYNLDLCPYVTTETFYRTEREEAARCVPVVLF